MDDDDLAVILSYRTDHPGRTARISIVPARQWNEHNPHIPVADAYDAPLQLGPVFNGSITYGERVPDLAAAARVLRAHERRLGLSHGALRADVSAWEG